MVKAKKQAKAADDPETLVLDYLRKTNRPYSATDVSTNLHNAVTKAAAQKALVALQEKGAVTGKLYGKQTVFVAKQDDVEIPSQEELDQMDVDIEQLKKEVDDLRETNKDLTSRLNRLMSQLTNEQIRAKLSALAEETAEYEQRLVALRSGGTKVITKEEKEQIDAAYETNRKLWAKRKRMFNDIFGVITEHMPGKPADLMVRADKETLVHQSFPKPESGHVRPSVTQEELGIETDAELGLDFNRELAVFR